MQRAVLVLLVVVAAYRVSLLDRGTSAFVDETLYFTSVMALQSLADGDPIGAARHITQARGRQGAALVQLPIAALQAIPSAFGVPASNPRSLLIPTVFNVALSVATVWFLFISARTLTGSAPTALIAAGLFAALVSSNLYLRHVLPYELSLAWAAASVALLVTRPRTAASVGVAGAMTALTVTCYAGYYLAAMAIALALAMSAWRRLGLRAATVQMGAFGAGAALVLGSVEVICRIGGTSYVESSRALGGTITMGSFDEGWTFLPEYLLLVEGNAGVVLLGGLGVWLIRFSRRLLNNQTIETDYWLAAACAAWFVQAVLSAEWHRIVFYGRLIHPWMFFLTLAVAEGLSACRGARIRWAVGAAVWGFAAVSIVPAAVTYRSLAYPSDVLYELGIDSQQVPDAQRFCEFDPGTPYESPGPADRETNEPYRPDGDFLLLNFCQQFTSGRLPAPAEPDDRALLYDGRHWLSYPAYTYDGFLPETRRDLQADPPRARVYGAAGSAAERRR